MSNHLQSDDASSDGVKPSASISAEFSSDVIERADEMLAFDEAYPISLLQRKLRIGYNTAQRLLNLVKEQRSLLSQDLPRVLKKAWHHAMDRYSSGKVNSERTLHAILYSQLVAALPDCTVLCEPQLPIAQHVVFVPDVVVINDQNQIVVVLEIKFVPHGYPVFEADIAKLRAIALDGQRTAYDLMLQAAVGMFADDKTTINPECLFVFAAVGRSDAKAIDAEVVEKAFYGGDQDAVAGRFLALAHATERPATEVGGKILEF